MFICIHRPTENMVSAIFFFCMCVYVGFFFVEAKTLKKKLNFLLFELLL